MEAQAYYDPSQVNLLVPSTTAVQVTPWHALRVSEVRANPDPNAGDVFKVGSRWNEQKKASEDLYSPAKPLLMRIASAAGIVFNWRESGPVQVQRDYVLYKAVGGIRMPDGTLRVIQEFKEIDLQVIEAELRHQYTIKAEGPCNDAARSFKGEWRKYKDVSGQERNGYFLAPEEKARYVEACVSANMIQWRKNKLMRAETGAILRVIRALLGMKAQYTREELEKPFVVPRVDFSPDYSDPQVRQAVIQHGLQAMAALYPSQPAEAIIAGGGNGGDTFVPVPELAAPYAPEQEGAAVDAPQEPPQEPEQGPEPEPGAEQQQQQSPWWQQPTAGTNAPKKGGREK